MKFLKDLFLFASSIIVGAIITYSVLVGCGWAEPVEEIERVKQTVKEATAWRVGE